MKQFTHASLFSGIGGPEVAAAMLGWHNAFHCEINPFGRAVLEYWFPDSISYADITKTQFKEWRGKIDVLTGGFPCQPFSYAGKRAGANDDRYLWPQMLRVIDEIRPTWVVGENVAGIATMVEGGYSLTWEVRELFSRRITTFTCTNSKRPTPLNESAKTLSKSDIRSNRFLFRLRVSEHPTGETESSSLPMMQTPTVVMTCESPEKNGYKNGTKYGSLASQVMYDPKVHGLLRTPCALDAKGNENRKYSGGGTLSQEIVQNPKLKGLLPTPTARDEKNPSSPDGERIARKKKLGYTIELNDLATMGLLPSPTARDFRPPYNEEAMVRKNGMVRDDMLSSLPTMLGLKKRGGCTFLLSPLFTEEMMGFPSLWTTLPFLQSNGGRKASKPTETQ